jgi:hypothetical protein
MDKAPMMSRLHPSRDGRAVVSATILLRRRRRLALILHVTCTTTMTSGQPPTLAMSITLEAGYIVWAENVCFPYESTVVYSSVTSSRTAANLPLGPWESRCSASLGGIVGCRPCAVACKLLRLDTG